MQILFKSRLNALMAVIIVCGAALVVAFCIKAFTEGPFGAPDAIQYDALIAGGFVFIVTTLLTIELVKNNLSQTNTWTKKSRFISRMLHGALILLAFSTYFDERGFGALASFFLPPVLAVSWFVSELIILVINKFKLSNNIRSASDTLAASYLKTDRAKKIMKIAAVMFSLYILFTLFEQMISNAFIN